MNELTEDANDVEGLVGSSGEDVPLILVPVFIADPEVNPDPCPAPLLVLSDLKALEVWFDEVLPKDILRGREYACSALLSRKPR